MTDTIEWRITPPAMDGGLASDANWTEFCKVITDEKKRHGTSKIIVLALNQMKESTPPKMEFRIKR